MSCRKINTGFSVILNVEVHCSLSAFAVFSCSDVVAYSGTTLRVILVQKKHIHLQLRILGILYNMNQLRVINRLGYPFSDNARSLKYPHP
jgi:hypothetical protein